jgi:hypothetical protein
MSLILDYISKHPELGIKVRYSTLSEYFGAVETYASQHKVQFTKFYGDLMPYSIRPETFWTGYLTSRPALKDYARYAERVQRTTDLLFSLARSRYTIPMNPLYDQLEILRRSNAMVQHHDAITGTERPHVLANYFEFLDNGLASVKQVESQTLSRLLGSTSDLKLTRHITMDKLVPIIVVNNLGWSRSEYVSIIVDRQVVVKDSKGNTLPNQELVPRGSNYEIYFETGQVSPGGFETYFLQQQTKTNYHRSDAFSNEVYDILFDGDHISGIRNKRSNVEIEFKQQVRVFLLFINMFLVFAIYQLHGFRSSELWCVYFQTFVS